MVTEIIQPERSERAGSTATWWAPCPRSSLPADPPWMNIYPALMCAGSTGHEHSQMKFLPSEIPGRGSGPNPTQQNKHWIGACRAAVRTVWGLGAQWKLLGENSTQIQSPTRKMKGQGGRCRSMAEALEARGRFLLIALKTVHLGLRGQQGKVGPENRSSLWQPPAEYFGFSVEDKGQLEREATWSAGKKWGEESGHLLAQSGLCPPACLGTTLVLHKRSLTSCRLPCIQAVGHAPFL